MDQSKKTSTRQKGKQQEGKKEEKERPKYNMWQNSAYMIALAVREKEKKVLLICFLQAALATAGSLTDL